MLPVPNCLDWRILECLDDEIKFTPRTSSALPLLTSFLPDHILQPLLSPGPITEPIRYRMAAYFTALQLSGMI